MWGLFSKDPSKEFPYEIQEQVGQVQLANKTVWQLHNGKHKSTGESVSVFSCDSKDGASDVQLDIARSAVKRLKTLKHPCILTFIASVESDKVVLLATEPVVPLIESLESLEDRGPKRNFYIAWGLFQVTRGLSFMINDAKLKHNNIHSSSVFVNNGGDWKISGLEYVSSVDQDSPIKVIPLDPPEKKDPSKRQLSTPWSADTWGLGCLIWEVFNGPLRSMDNLGTLGDIPKDLCPAYKECVGANPKKRPNPKDLLEKMKRSPGYFKNELIDVLVFLEEIQFKEDADKNRFFSSLAAQLDSCPDIVARGKILPQLINAFEFSNAGSAILGPVFKIGKSLNTQEYQERVVPCLVKLFSSNDRNARFKLLSQIETFVEHLNNKIVNDQVFPKIESGFLDSEPLIREKTVIAMIHLAPKLNYSNLDEIVILKHFTRLVRDEQGGIRTNTVVCLGKIARYLHPKTRQQVLLACFSRSLKDPFPPSRIAAINAIAATQQYYTVQETGGRVLPLISSSVIDPEKSVRDQGFKVLRGFINKLEKVSEDPSLKEEMEKEVGSTSPVAAAAAGWANWAVGAVTAKFYKSSIAPNPGAASGPGGSSGGGSKEGTPQPEAPVLTPAKVTTGSDRKTVSTESSGKQEEGWNIDEWNDTDKGDAGKGWEVDEKDGGGEDGWEDDGDWGELEVAGAKKTAATDNFSSDWGNFETNTTSRSHDPFSEIRREDERKKNEDKKAERQKAIEAKRSAKKGPMKLGAKKMID
ncbi:N-terminal kinase-like protein isoform X2 [Eurytemora carolleeae]|uniref:N-terminal kinase-like protein isoform X1 n=1 Tax=Eurytemora carolleeae TaxID=1294199 RepID=UPI000C77D9C3|nr:N-terminal kinase-like protein isoform X1 [Eurytemora carolleeae]XP_023343202.1 N-terminal kinase-like protein isoform X2 [Eurytemora carolleeae]|eukprot:XP_023343193.1 N-terminal kinase-like protein isoform X1 [Eurytemora affinis]